jgi:hypothetical protein
MEKGDWQHTKKVTYVVLTSKCTFVSASMSGSVRCVCVFCV